MDDETNPRLPLDELRKQYDEERYFGDDRAAAEYAYALAVRLRDDGDVDGASTYARECLRLTEGLPARSLDDVASNSLSVGGVPLPERFHNGVVRARLGDLLDR